MVAPVMVIVAMLERLWDAAVVMGKVIVVVANGCQVMLVPMVVPVMAAAVMLEMSAEARPKCCGGGQRQRLRAGSN